ncbi:hypothetical protein [Actinoallomurus acanthiterrae]
MTQACQAAGLDAEQYGAEVFIRGASSHLSERIVCKPDDHGRVRWHWSGGMPIGRLNDSSQLLGLDDVDELIQSISRSSASRSGEWRCDDDS